MLRAFAAAAALRTDTGVRFAFLLLLDSGKAEKM
jgi:hypothetical protein